MGSKAIKDPERMGMIVASALDLRRKFSFVIAIPIISVLFFLLRENGSPYGDIFLLSLLVLCMVGIQMLVSILYNVMQLHEKQNQYQKYLLSNTLLRFAFIVIFLSFATNPIILICGSVVINAMLFYVYLKPKASSLYRVTEKKDEAIERNYKAIAINSFPNTFHAYYKTQITFVLITIFGATSQIAEFGALSKLLLIYVIPASIAQSISKPILAKLKEDDLSKGFLLHLGVSLLTAAIFFCFVIIFNQPLLSLLGESFVHMKKELLIFTATTSLQFIANSSFQIIGARGWHRFQWTQPLFLISVQILCIFIFDISMLTGILWIGFAEAVALNIWVAVMIVRGFRGKGSVLQSHMPEES